MRDRQDLSGGTLDRLNDALSSLENRIGIPRAGATSGFETDALSAIRARQTALAGNSDRSRAQMPMASAPQQNDLRAALTDIRRELEAEINANVSAGFDRVRHDIRAIQAAPAADNASAISTTAAQLRQEIAELKSDVTKLAREDTLQGMMDRWAVLETEISQMPQKLGSREELMAVAQRLDEVHGAIAHLPHTSELASVEDQVRTLAMAVQSMVENQGGMAFPMDAVEARFDELSRAIAALPANIPSAQPSDPTAFDRIEARIAEVAAQLDQHMAIPGLNSLDDHFAHLSTGIDSLREQANEAIGKNEINALSERLDHIAQHIATAPQNVDTSNNAGALAELNERLHAIVEQVNNSDLNAQQAAQSIAVQVDQKMDEIARRIDANETSATVVPSIGTLEMRLDEIAQILSNSAPTSDATSSNQLASLEQQVANLTQSLSGNGSAIDQDSLLSAARAAADEAVARMGTVGQSPAGDNLAHLADDLKSLELLARDSDERNTRTFEAIHDTLLKVVDHLAGLENTITTAPAAAQDPATTTDQFDPMPAVSAEMVNTPQTPLMSVDDAPSIDPDNEFDGYGPAFASAPQPPKPRAALSPAEAAAAAARNALEQESDIAPVSANPMPEAPLAEEASSKSLLKGMAQKLRRGAAKTEETITTPVVDEALVDDGSQLVSGLADEPIEPGSGGADLSAIMRRVREERAGTGASDAATPARNVDDNGKSDFIAAARRAAKAAAADATVAKRDTEKANGEKSSLGALLAKRRKPILMGAGAILLALLSLPLISGLFSSPNEQSEVAQISSAPPAVEQTIEAEPSETAEVRIIGEDENTSDLEDPLALEAETQPDIAAEEIDVAAAPAITLADVPENVGPIALREAAVDGDATALYVVGDYFTGGVPGQSENDLTKALTWYERSAELGFAPAQYRVGNFYEKGLGTSRDIETAKTWYQLAAEQGNAAAMHNLAVLFASGANGSPDFESATRWFQNAAELGVKDSQFNLGILSAKGEGIAKDLGESYKWFSIAAKTGDKDAAAKRDEVAEVLRPDQLETARGAAELWKPKPIIEAVNMVSVPEAWQTDVSQTAAAQQQATQPAVGAAEMKKAIRNIQGILNNNGYNAGPADGIMGTKTRSAIIEFKKANGLEPNADINEPLVRKLLELNESRKNG